LAFDRAAHTFLLKTEGRKEGQKTATGGAAKPVITSRIVEKWSFVALFRD
jgi:hypothetical protein